MYKGLRAFVIVSVLAVPFAFGGEAAAAAQAAPDLSGNGVAAGRDPKAMSGLLTAVPQQPLATAEVGRSCSVTAPLNLEKALPQPDKNASTGLSLTGTFSFTINASGARMMISHIVNSRASGTSGALRLQLWATTTVPTYGGTISEYTLGSYDLAPLSAGTEYNNVDTGYVTYTAPPAGCYYITLALLELQSGTYYYQDLDTASAGGTPDGSGHDLFSFGGANCSAATTCVRDANTACLLSGRFKVSATYKTSSATGEGTVMYFGSSRAETDESVFLWFFDASNFEMGMKMLDGCTLNNHFWVYIGGLTDQGWTLNVVDTQTGASRTYSNALGHLSSSVADTSALPCP
jgi:hypothetical protein